MHIHDLLILLLLILVIPGGYLLQRHMFGVHRLFKQLCAQSSVSQADTSTKQTVPQFEASGTERPSQKRQSVHHRDERLLKAGLLRQSDRRLFRILQVVLPILLALLSGYFAPRTVTYGSYYGLAFGTILGLYLPEWYLEHAIKERSEDIMFYLPLFIEQLVIGVSSGLDIGPCIQRIVTLADQRDAHNVVTELFKNVQVLIRYGTPLIDALEEVASIAGHTELRHTCMTLGQVSRHGGEISKQLQELAHTAASQRETKIEAKIKLLELHATGPVVLVFVSFMSVLFLGVGLQIMKGLSMKGTP